MCIVFLSSTHLLSAKVLQMKTTNHVLHCCIPLMDSLIESSALWVFAFTYTALFL